MVVYIVICRKLCDIQTIYVFCIKQKDYNLTYHGTLLRFDFIVFNLQD